MGTPVKGGKPVVDWDSYPEPWRTSGKQWFEKLQEINDTRPQHRYPCDRCGADFLSLSGLSQHRRQAHPRV